MPFLRISPLKLEKRSYYFITFVFILVSSFCSGIRSALNYIYCRQSIIKSSGGSSISQTRGGGGRQPKGGRQPIIWPNYKLAQFMNGNAAPTINIFLHCLSYRFLQINASGLEYKAASHDYSMGKVYTKVTNN